MTGGISTVYSTAFVQDNNIEINTPPLYVALFAWNQPGLVNSRQDSRHKALVMRKAF